MLGRNGARVRKAVVEVFNDETTLLLRSHFTVASNVQYLNIRIAAKQIVPLIAKANGLVGGLARNLVLEVSALETTLLQCFQHSVDYHAHLHRRKLARHMDAPSTVRGIGECGARAVRHATEA